ncbi:hypothetical protein CLV46_2101 [Diaminobutyricimonas aerilata]|uniref:TIGR01777 family protein n=1 Tax=Diaminobutyricimonas aerilata TaxID=1162967 RepID=A0A2M9CKY4_9MICO|nr:TIGR01777 family oxidoreductase [Diaminobutyricimonas aerilata]PJJ72529.1 hypothetical protein CLV46_2101 [Diaminobutyricimonas aerilata]
MTSAHAPGSEGRLRVLVSGASGLIGTELVRQLRGEGHEVVRLVRRAPRSVDEVTWAPESRTIDATALDGVDAVVNLSGASLARLPWTAKYRRELLASRVQATTTLAEAMSTAATPPRVFVSGSAVGFYGDRSDESLTEQSAKGDGFLADLVERWEAAAHRAPEGTRVVTARTGIVIGKGGVLSPIVPLTTVGLGSRFGSGRQHWPWISLHDEAAALRHLLTASALEGPVNLVGPTPATSGRITEYVARRLHRWHAFVVPGPLIRFALRDAGRELLLADQEVVPERLLADGFRFRHERVEDALDDFVGR